MALTTVPASLSATALTLTTAAQPNITSVGTLTGLTVSGAATFSSTVDAVADVTVSNTSTNSAGVKFATASANRYIESTHDGIINIGTGGTLGGGTKYLTIDSGNVGIGETNPSEKFVVKGDGARMIVSSADMEVAMLGRAGSSGSALDQGYLRLRNQGVTADGAVINSAGTSWLNGGNVGIGTSSPQATLHLKSTAASTGPSLIFENTNNAQAMNIDYYNNSGSVQSRIRYSEGPGSFEIMPNSSANAAMILLYNGNVGIGTTNPSAKLDVVANDTVWAGEFTQSNTSNGDGVIVTVGSTAAADYALSIRSNAGNTPGLNVKADGNVGIGTFTPGKTLDVEGAIRAKNAAGSSAAEIDVTSGSTWRFRSNPTSGTNSYGLDIIKGGAGTDVKMSIDNQGRVTKPSNPSFQVRCSSVNNIDASSGYTVPYGGHSVQHNVGSHFNTSNYRFTAPIAGSYLFSASLRVDDFSSNAQYSYITLKHYNSGGTAQSDKGRDLSSSTGNYKHHAIVSVVYLAAGDYVNVQLVTFNDTSTDLNDQSWFSGYLLG